MSANSASVSVTMSAREKRFLLLLCVIIMARLLGLFMLLPVFAIEGQQLIGATPFKIGLAIGIYALFQAFLQLPFGALSDRYGRRVLVVFGLVLFIAGGIIAAMSESITGVIIGRSLQGSGAISSVIMAWVADITKPENRSKAMATIGMSIGLAFGLAMLLGPIVTKAFGLSGLFWVIVALAVISLVLSLIVPENAQCQDAAVSFSAVKSALFGSQWLFNVGVFLIHFVMTAVFLLLPLRMAKSADIPLSYHGYIYFAVMMLGFISMVPMIIRAEKYGKIFTAMKSASMALLLSLGLMLFTDSASVVWLIIAMWAYFWGFNLLEALMPSWLSRQAEKTNSKGAAMGAYSASQFIGAFLGGSLGGSILGAGTPSTLWMVLLGTTLIWVFVLFIAGKPLFES